jgi:hypothetical protein
MASAYDLQEKSLKHVCPLCHQPRTKLKRHINEVHAKLYFHSCQLLLANGAPCRQSFKRRERLQKHQQEDEHLQEAMETKSGIDLGQTQGFLPGTPVTGFAKTLCEEGRMMASNATRHIDLKSEGFELMQASEVFVIAKVEGSKRAGDGSSARDDTQIRRYVYMS